MRSRLLRDDGVGALEDRVRRAVVLLERDRLRAREVALELEDVADVGAAKGVDGLVGVAHGADVVVLPARSCSEPVLGVVRVLVLVDEQVAERLLPARPRLVEALEHLDGQHQQVVEVDRVRGVQARAGRARRPRRRSGRERRDRLGVPRRRRSWFLAFEIWAWMPRGTKRFGSVSSSSQALLHEPQLVGGVVDREVRAVAEPLGLAAQDPAAGGVEREDQIARATGAGERLTRSRISPAALFVKVMARISFGVDAHAPSRCATRWVSTRVLPEPAPASTSSGPSVVQDGLALRGIQAGEVGARATRRTSVRC